MAHVVWYPIMSTCVRQSCIRFTAAVFTHSRAYLFSRCCFPSSASFPRAACRGEGNVFQWLMRAISLSGRSEKQCLSDILTHLCENERWYLNNLHLFPNLSDTKTCDFQLISFYIGIWHCNMSLYPLPAVLILMMGVSDNMWSLISSVNGSLGTLSLRQRWGLPF